MATACSMPTFIISTMNRIDTDVFLPHLAYAFLIILLASLAFLILLEVASFITACISAFKKGVRHDGPTYRHFHGGEDLDLDNMELENGEAEVTESFMVLVPGKMKDDVLTHSQSRI